ncbi:VPA1262 family N-terminal domain-containing protein [Pseudomonas sp. GD03858]|uniref:VPA1262 family N-terminal domain-containing protein n=1 Tax=unclassified Pseudomonas TaxID=196821 RepID=UPI00244ACBCC|nr:MULTISPECIES: VPA1262 family N-terminal domain-containing protein [unclassified Pseudomonas]MDH0648739.1 VPA1262 family N-terminal domain-containing protein [Pseudomonas sp. GD03867]MDH0664937.1 VPA1262 family N-terminal domain-containing protein [Pseudomonas sp. GD03858]
MNTVDVHELAREYNHAVVRLTTFQATAGVPAKLLFGSVSLLASGRSPEKGMTGIHTWPLRGAKAQVHFRRIVMTAEAALRWYRSAAPDNFATPLPMQREAIEEKFDGVPVDCTGFEDNPVWPELGIPFTGEILSGLTGREDPAPFRGDAGARVHRRFGDGNGFEAVLKDKDCIRFLQRRIHFNIAEYSEYLGSLALIVPDPVIERIDNYLVPATPDSAEQACIRLVARTGKSLSDLQITFFERSANLLSRFYTRDIPEDGVVLHDRASEMASSGFLISHKVHKLLAYQPLSNYLRRMSVQMNVMSSPTKVAVPLRDKLDAPVKSYMRHRNEPLAPSTWGEVAVSSSMRVAQGAERRRQQGETKRFDQRWFGDDEREAAIDFIHDRIEHARRRVIMADPYFGALQIAQFAPKVSSQQVSVIVITSRTAFDDLGTLPKDSVRKDMTLEEYEQLREKRKKQNSSAKLKKFKTILNETQNLLRGEMQAYVLTGRKTKLHDRFLVVDDDVWFMGHSFSSLGDAPALILKVPNADEVIQQLFALTKSAPSFEKYLRDFDDRAKRTGGA